MSNQEVQKSLEEGPHIQLYHFRWTGRRSHLSSFVATVEGCCGFDVIIGLVVGIGLDGNCLISLLLPSPPSDAVAEAPPGRLPIPPAPRKTAVSLSSGLSCRLTLAPKCAFKRGVCAKLKSGANSVR